MISLELGKVLLDVFLIMAVIGAVFGVYNLYDPLAFPGLLEKLVWVIVSLGALNIIVRVPFKVFPSELDRSIQEQGRKLSSGLIFQILLAAFLLSLILQQFYSEWANININYLLLSVIVFGALAMLFETENKPLDEPSIGYYIFSVVTGIAASGIVWLKVVDLGLTGAAISVLSGVLVLLLSVMLPKDIERKHEQVEDKSFTEANTHHPRY